MNEIKLNLENLSQEEREQLMKLVEKANKPKYEQWIPKDKEYYYYLGVDGSVNGAYWHDNSNIARFGVKYGNFFKTKEEAERFAEKRRIEVELQNIANELNNGWKPNWEDPNEAKYSIVKGASGNILIDYDYNLTRSTIYFKTREFAKQAIEHIGEERLKKYFNN